MIVDVSEIKAFRHCKRQWQLSSRNQFHLTTVAPMEALETGSAFHECLHKLYLGKSIEDTAVVIDNAMIEDKSKTLLRSMVSGYSREVIDKDLDKYEVLEIEYHFEIDPIDICQFFQIPGDFYCRLKLSNVKIKGSIDMIVQEKETGKIWGFEHKTAKNFRNSTYTWMDEQPRVYYVALLFYVLNRCNNGHKCDIGGVVLNEVRKLVRAFDYKRSYLTYSPSDIKNFMCSFLLSVSECKEYTLNSNLPRVAQPDYMKCQTCTFNTVCEHYQYEDVTLEDLMQEFKLEFKVREEDHLENKEGVQVSNG